MRLQGKTALVTGATSNIGRAIAVAFAAEGAHVVVAGRDKTRGDAVVAEIEAAGGRADFAAADLDGAEAARALAADATRILGRVDILVNNAGLVDGSATTDVAEETFDRLFAVNVKAPYFLVGALAPAMAERGGGTIINLGSWIARLGIPIGSLYSATKGALETLTKAWAAEFGPRGVRVNAISPGVVHEMSLAHTPAAAMMNGTPAGAPGKPDAIAHAAVYLASDEAAFVHGSTLDVDGGRQNVAVIAE
jgi:NAD(P)-dependent dehydrogenase (short-subunit alcohol dehydrogenase family)